MIDKTQSKALVKAILWKEELEGDKWENFLCKPNAPKEAPWGYHGGVSSESWFILDGEGMEYLRTKFSELEIGRIMFIASMIGDSDFCFLVNSKTGKGHTKGTLCEALGVHRNTFIPFLKKLIDENVVVVVSTPIKRKKVERIMFNPSIARRKDYMYGMALEPFQDLRNKLGRPLPRKGNRFSTIRVNN
jgi:hypothetical protein